MRAWITLLALAALACDAPAPRTALADVRPHDATFWVVRQYCDVPAGEYPCVWSADVLTARGTFVPCLRWEIRNDSGLLCDFEAQP